jgi:hypothetical protein
MKIIKDRFVLCISALKGVGFITDEWAYLYTYSIERFLA